MSTTAAPFADIIADCGAKLLVTRYAAPSIVNGRKVRGAASTFSAVMSVQPLSSKELEFVPEGLRARGVRAVFSNTKLQTLPDPDRFTYDGDTWEVVKEDDWIVLASYGRYTAARVTLP
jgi:hypothetical protein